MRAQADRLIVDVANTKYLAASLAEGDIDRLCPATGWTVRQTLGHLALMLEFHADGLPGLSGVAPPGPGSVPDWDSINAAMAGQTAHMPLPEIHANLVRGRDRCIEGFLDLTMLQLGREIVPGVDLLAVLKTWDRHFAIHAIDLADALPALRRDPLVLNWVLHADYRRDPGRLARQQALAAEARERLAEEEDHAP